MSALLEHLLAFEEPEDVYAHIQAEHSERLPVSLPRLGAMTHRELDHVHLVDHKRHEQAS